MPADYVELVKYIATAIVSQPGAVDVQIKEGPRAWVVELKLAPEDVGRIIGRQGRNIDAIRSVVRAAGLKDHKRVVVEIV
jgi:predicted RNA-binding protein YlqC (UPF0109 family)